MQCPSCHSAVTPDIRFCLQCGQFLGELDESTYVRARTPPPSTMRVDYADFARYGATPLEYERPRKRRWPFIVAASGLAGIVLMVLGGVLAVQFANRSDPPNNSRLGALASSPTATPLPERALSGPAAQVASPPPEQQAPQPTVKPITQVESDSVSTPQPTPRRVLESPPVSSSEGAKKNAPLTPAVNTIVITWADWLRDGASVSWRLAPGVYRLDLTSNNDGVTAEWTGASCPKTAPMLRFSTVCEVPGGGVLVVTNPTTYGLGKSCLTTVRVIKLVRP